MLLRLYVHDLHLEIGHSRATIDILNHLGEDQKSGITELEVIAFTSTPLDKLFPWKKTKRTFVKVPFPKLYPFILKSIFYQLWTMFYHWLHPRNDVISLSVGIAFPFSDIVNVQFIHHHWNELNQIYQRSPWYKKIYKKCLFAYFDACEKLIYHSGERNFIVLSRFTKDYLDKRFKLAPKQSHLTYSSVNVENFNVLKKSKVDLRDELLSEAPSLARLNLRHPIFLFVGGYERKGLPRAIELIKKYQNAQFIVVGRPEDRGQDLKWPSHIEVHQIPFTKKLNSYYNLADYFIFPTTYEPFGLVILEAAFTGLDLILPERNVGASELLLQDRETYFMDKNDFKMPHPKVKSLEERILAVERRKEMLKDRTWEKSSQIFYQDVLSKYFPTPPA